ncbi:hypothetical protein TNCV_3536921 [Trichonephila clavipes]|uniref:Uncharacterized protein n=1 Tax=Trichonephila clavipes TaxID=2585209 RepID=A0A8X7B9D5_TRICX|nr:hypothetical protein TNCV_3536921 [Trichonephila clavipes]
MMRHFLPNPNWVFSGLFADPNGLRKCCLSSREEDLDLLVSALLRRLYGPFRCSLQVLVGADSFPRLFLEILLIGYGLFPA